MRLLKVDTKDKKVSEIKTFAPLKGTYDAIQTAAEQENDGTFLIDRGDGKYYEFNIEDGQPHFLPGNEGLHEGEPEQHMARMIAAPTRLADIKEQYGGFHLDTPDDPEQPRYEPPSDPDPSAFENDGPARTEETPAAEDAPAEDAPVEDETPSEDAPSEEAPPEETPTEAPAEDVIEDDGPAEETEVTEEEVTEAETTETEEGQATTEEIPVEDVVPETDEEDPKAKSGFEEIPEGEAAGDEGGADAPAEG